MASVRSRVVAFAPVVTLSLLAAGAAVLGYRSADEVQPKVERPAATAPSPSRTPSAGPFVPVPSVTPLLAAPPAGSKVLAGQSWNRAIHKLIHVASARYSWAVYYGADPEPLQSESGGFDLDPFRSNFDRSIAVGDGKRQVVHLRRFGDATYMQLDHWGNWTGCWLSVTPEMIKRQTGVDPSGSLPLPVGVLAVTDATITGTDGFWFGAPFREYTGEVSAAEALQFLGISPQVFRKQIDRLIKIKVPITVSLDASGQIHGGGARGSEVAAAIHAAAPGMLKRLVSGLPQLRGAFALKGLGAPVGVPRPPAKSILPPGAKEKDSCSAGGPRA